jgi:hypothetical protein
LTGQKLLNGATQANAATALHGQFLVPATPSIQKRFAAMKQTVSRSEQQSISSKRSNIVDRRQPTRTAAIHGISGPEIKRFSAAVQLIQKHCPRCARLWWVSLNKGSTREVISDVQKRITKLQKRANLPPYNATVFETLGGLHAHIVFIGNPALVQCLEKSAKFSNFIQIDQVYDPQGLARRYLAKERTPQAGYKRTHMLGGRIAGSHQLPGGGDRVRLSRELERDAIEAGYVDAWQHTNAKRSVEEKPYRPCPCSSRRERHRPSGRR